jgi:Niemann-Pick C1 N terminus
VFDSLPPSLAQLKVGQVESQLLNKNCVWYGVCDHVNGKTKNCFDDKPPRALDEDGVRALKKWCPHLIENENEVKTCCDNENVSEKIFFLFQEMETLLFFFFEIFCSCEY